MKILDPIGRLVARYFGRPATSVSPEIQPDGGAGGPVNQAANPQLAKLIEELTGLNDAITTSIRSGIHLGPFGPETAALMHLHEKTLGNPVELPNPIGALGPYEGNIARGNVGGVTPDALEQIRKTVEGMFPGRRVVMHTDLPTTGADPEPKGIKPPDRLAWDQWKQMMAEERLPGWSPCKFANRGRFGAAKFVFGIARDQIGMYRMPFDCCLQNEDHTESDMGEKVLTALTHLPTGLGMGLFETQAEAALAVDLMLPVIKDWVALDPDAIGVMEWLLPIQTAWTFGGLAPTDEYHAHDQGSPPLYVWKRSDAAANHGRPEKLS